MAQTVQYSGISALRPKPRENWLKDLSDRSQDAYLGFMSRLLNSKSLRYLALRECTEVTHYKGKTIETTVFSDGLWSWHARHTVWPARAHTGDGCSITTEGLLACNAGEALALAVEDVQEIIDDQLT